ncbi:BTB/POZ domain containing protein 3-like protein [Aphelenchoides avenae]|nr:BTB/POZ domain containing protein 3-like protein [Aphelenchus avenae]KAH7702905.1 BTB/POZ domain containing protein 3-like protein [Aphelenchus avenae]
MLVKTKSPDSIGKRMFLGEKTADVHFILNPLDDSIEAKVPAHKAVLGTASDVFYAMFFGDFVPPNEVEVADANANSLKAMLRFIYTGETELTTSNATEVLYLARKYLLNDLVEAIASYLDSEITPHNVCDALSYCELFDEDRMDK